MRSWLFLAIISSACQSHGPWEYKNIPEKELGHCSRVLYPSRDISCGIDLEFIKAGDTLTTYLQVRGGMIPLSHQDEQMARLTILSGEQKNIFFVRFHQGNERLRLSDLQQSYFLSLLQEGKQVTLELEGFQETIDPTYFEEFYKKLNQAPYRLPFHLPI